MYPSLCQGVVHLACTTIVWVFLCNAHVHDPHLSRARFLNRLFHAVEEKLCLAFCCFGQRLVFLGCLICQCRYQFCLFVAVVIRHTWARDVASNVLAGCRGIPMAVLPVEAGMSVPLPRQGFYTVLLGQWLRSFRWVLVLYWPVTVKYIHVAILHYINLPTKVVSYSLSLVFLFLVNAIGCGLAAF